MKGSQFQNDDSDILPRYKVIILGKSHAGKTKLLLRHQQDFYEDSGITTISVQSHIVKKKNAIYAYYDTAGQDRYRAIIDSYYRGSDACLIVYDVSDIKSFDEVSYYFNRVKQLTQNCLVYIVGCKSDLKHEISEQQVNKRYKGIQHLLTSAKTNYNVKQLFGKVQADLLALKKGVRQSAIKIRPMIISTRKDQKKPCCK